MNVIEILKGAYTFQLFDSSRKSSNRDHTLMRRSDNIHSSLLLTMSLLEYIPHNFINSETHG